jgi:hypothetical protein
MIAFFHSDAVNLDDLTSAWCRLCFKIFNDLIVRVNGRAVLIIDGIKAPKEGKKMPGVKSLHQSSDNNSKPQYIMGHSCQGISLLVGALKSFLAIPLIIRINEGIKLSPKDKRTIFDKAMLLLDVIGESGPCYLTADAYYAVEKMIHGLFERGHHLVSRVKKSAVAFATPGANLPRNVGRPRKYGERIKLIKIFDDKTLFQTIDSPVYGEADVKLLVRVIDLLWKPVGDVIRFCLVIHPSRGMIVLMTTDLSLLAVDIVKIYGLRFKIEFGFKQAVHQLGCFCYHFWSKSMKKIKRCSGDQYLHKIDEATRELIIKKFTAYQLHLQIGMIAQGLLQYLAIKYCDQIWKSFGGWLRTIRDGIVPSEQVVSIALRNGYYEFLHNKFMPCSFRKFMEERITLYNSREELDLAG